MSNTRLFYVFVLGISLTMTGCSFFSSEEQPESGSASAAVSGNADYDNMLAEVTAKFKALAKEGGAWTVSEDNLEAAAEAAKKKEFDKAIKLLKEVDAETTMARAQFDRQKNAGPHLF